MIVFQEFDNKITFPILLPAKPNFDIQKSHYLFIVVIQQRRVIIVSPPTSGYCRTVSINSLIAEIVSSVNG